ncbi:MAG: glycosyltransferase family 2 protein [Muribaculaceae bacterium]|nr:glycosyltransferase family 2 protein [Muribaculaceae bacterium]
MTAAPKTAVIILNWNGLEMMRRFLPSVVRFTEGEDVRVIVADNGSTDGSTDWLRAAYPQVELISFEENLGFAGGYDKAIRMVEAEYVVLLNSDVEVTPGWWQTLLEVIESHPEAGAVQPKILSAREKSEFEHAGAAGGLIDRMGYPYCRGRRGGKTERDRGQYDSPQPVEIAWASGAAMMVRRRAFLDAGGLDPDFFAHMEEIDLCWRMRLNGYRIYAVTGSVVYHYGGGALPYGNPRKTYLNFRNNLLMLHKNLPRKYGRRFLFRRRLMDTFAFFLFLCKGELKNAKAVVRAHRDFKKMRAKYTDFPDKNLLRQLPGTDKFSNFLGF